MNGSNDEKSGPLECLVRRGLVDMTKEEIEKHKENPNILLKVGGKPFRCECGCNVFHHPGTDADEYCCNACGSRFTAG